MIARRPLRIWTALALLGAYALSLLFPPGAGPLLPPEHGATLSARLFPGVPPWWVWSRLICLAAGAVAASAAFATPLTAGPASPPVPRSPGWKGRVLWLVAAVAALHLLSAFYVAEMGRGAQKLFIAAIAAPTLLTAALHPPRGRGRVPVGPWVLVTTVWLAAWGPIAWRSPWIASIVDSNGVLDMLRSALRPDYNLLTSTVRPGQSSMYLVFQGAGLIDGHVTPTLTYLQAVHFVWIVIAAAVTATAAERLTGSRVAATVATACLLFSPAVLIETLFTGPLFLGWLLAGVLVLCCLAIHERGSAVATTMAGAVTGLMAIFPSLVSLGYPGLACAMWLAATRRPRVPTAAIVTACLTFAACVVPVLPGMLRLDDLVSFYNSGRGEWATMQATFFGQLNPDLARFQMTAGDPGPADALLGSLLSPFATPRTALRLWGDAMFEPIGAALAAVGLVSCARAPRGGALLLLTMTVLSVAMGALSSYDRASLMRLPALPFSVAVLAAVGFDCLRRQLAPTGSAAGAALALALLSALSGWSLMTLVNPRILARSGTTIVMEALAGAERDAAVLLPRGWDPQSSPGFLADVSRPPVPTAVYAGPADLTRDGDRPVARLVFWSPGTEERSAVSAHVCERWPAARLFTLADAAGLSRVYAAAVDGATWVPGIPATRWSASACGTRLETEGARAARALAKARRLLAGGRPGDAIELMRRTARETFVQVALFDALAETLLEHGATPAAREEARAWATRAATTSGYCLPGPLRTLSRAYAALGRDEAFRVLLERDPEDRARACANLPAGHPFRTGILRGANIGGGVS